MFFSEGYEERTRTGGSPDLFLGGGGEGKPVLLVQENRKEMDRSLSPVPAEGAGDPMSMGNRIMGIYVQRTHLGGGAIHKSEPTHSRGQCIQLPLQATSHFSRISFERAVLLGSTQAHGLGVSFSGGSLPQQNQYGVFASGFPFKPPPPKRKTGTNSKTRKA